MVWKQEIYLSGQTERGHMTRLSVCLFLSSSISWLAMLFYESVKSGTSDWIWVSASSMEVYVCIGGEDRDEVLPVVWIYTAAGCFLPYVQWSSMRKINSATCVSAEGNARTQHVYCTHNNPIQAFKSGLLSKMSTSFLFHKFSVVTTLIYVIWNKREYVCLRFVK